MRPRQLLVAAAVIAAGSFAVRLRWSWDGDTFLVLRWPEWPQGAVLFTLAPVTAARRAAGGPVPPHPHAGNAPPHTPVPPDLTAVKADRYPVFRVVLD